MLDLKDYERALVWIDGRFSHVLPPGLYAYWTGLREVRGRVSRRCPQRCRFEHPDLRVISRSASVERVLELATVEPHHQGVLFVDGQFVATLPPGRYAFWKNMAQVKFVQEDLREQMIDIAGQEIMTADKVTLRMNAVVTYRVADARQAVSTVDNASRRCTARPSWPCGRWSARGELDTFLVDSDAVARELEELLRQRVSEFGLEVVSVGVRDMILPGDMKDLMNSVTEAKKAAEANLIARREETAAMRSQANTAKLLEASPTLDAAAGAGGPGKDRHRPASSTSCLGEKGLTERVVNLL